MTLNVPCQVRCDAVTLKAYVPAVSGFPRPALPSNRIRTTPGAITKHVTPGLVGMITTVVRPVASTFAGCLPETVTEERRSEAGTRIATGSRTTSFGAFSRPHWSSARRRIVSATCVAPAVAGATVAIATSPSGGEPAALTEAIPGRAATPTAASAKMPVFPVVSPRMLLAGVSSERYASGSTPRSR